MTWCVQIAAVLSAYLHILRLLYVHTRGMFSIVLISQVCTCTNHTLPELRCAQQPLRHRSAPTQCASFPSVGPETPVPLGYMPYGGPEACWSYGLRRKALDDHAGDLRGKEEEAAGGNCIAGTPESQQLRQRAEYCPVAALG